MTKELHQVFFVVLLAIVTCASAPAIVGQSNDQNLPTPIRSDELTGTITALDLGDARLTRHYYAFAAKPGDLLITLDSKNLNGDIDVFTAITFRPLMKATMYANTSSPEVTKGIYLRQTQILILRVEARTPNDEPGSYHIRFSGTFEPFSGGIPVAETTETPVETTSPSGGRRVTSVGATIPEPVTEKPVVAEAQPSPQPTPDVSDKPPASDSATPKKTTSKSRPGSPTPRTTARRRTPPPPKKPATTENKTEAPASTSDVPKTENPTGGATGEVKPATNEQPADTAKSKAQEIPIPQPNSRLIIEEKDGTRIEHPMSTVRRLVVEGNTIVITLKTGKVERISMSVVTRMSIEPQ